LNSFGNWRCSTRSRKLGVKQFELTTIRVNDKNIKNFLIDNDYDKKSLVSPTKIINKIPNSLRNYFFRGLIDGDGCFCSKNRNYFSLTGNINQDWCEVERLLNEININHYKLSKKIRKTGDSSFIVISNRNDIIKVGDYIYGAYDNIGLYRKYKIYEEILNKPISKYSNIK